MEMSIVASISGSHTPLSRVPAHRDVVARIGVEIGEHHDRAAVAREIARENRQAALQFDLDPADPRLALANRTRAELQGTVLPADGRDRLLTLATQLSLRPFEANMIIAIVQDEARLGTVLHRPAVDATRHRVDRLRIIPRPERTATGQPAMNGNGRWADGVPIALQIVLALSMAVLIMTGILNWLI